MTVAATNLPSFKSVQFVDPWAPLPPLPTQTGVIVTTTPAPAQGFALAIRLLQAGTPIAESPAPVNGPIVELMPIAPLSAALQYTIQVQWVKQGTTPDWSQPVATAPLVTAPVRVLSGTVTAAGISLQWNGDVSGAEAKVFDQEPFLRASMKPIPGRTGLIPFQPLEGSTYSLYVNAVQPVESEPEGGFASPFSYGPATAPILLPTAGPTISLVAYDGETVGVKWAPITLPAAPVVAEVDYTLNLAAADGSSGIAAASSSGGRIDLQTDAASGVTVAGSVSFDAIVGPLGKAQQVLTARPQLAALTLGASKTMGQTVVKAEFAALSAQPQGTQVSAILLQDGAVLASGAASGAPLTAEFDHALPGGHHYELQARLEVPTGPPRLLGPLIGPAPVLAPAPQVTRAAYDGTRLVLAWQGGPPAGVVGHQVTLTPASGSKIVLEAGPEPLLGVDVFLDLTTTWTAIVEPIGVASTGLASAAQSVALPAVAAPKVRRLDYDGETLLVEWNAASLPGLSGYSVTLSGGGGGTFPIGPGTSLVLPLTPSQAAGATVTVTGVSATRTTSASAPATVVVAAPVIAAVAVPGGVEVTWSVTSPPSGASTVVELLDGDAVVETVTTSNSKATLTAPTSPGNYSVRARVVAGVGRGPNSAAVPVLTQRPTISFAAILDDALSLAWAPDPESAVGGYRVSFGPSGSHVTMETAATQLAVPLPEKGLEPGTVSVTPVGPRTTGPVATVAIVAGYTVASGTYDGSTLSVELGGSLSPAPGRVWVDVLLEGRLAARTRHDGAPSGAITVPVSLPPGAAAAVRAIGVGAGPITPPSAAVAIPTSPPRGVSAVYDGQELHVAWQPVPDPGVSGYQVSVAGSSPPVSPTIVSGRATRGTKLTASFSLPLPANAAISVSAVSAAGQNKYLLGPSATAVPTLTGFARSIEAPAAGQPPYLYRRGAYQELATVQSEEVVSYLPKPFVGADDEIIPSGENKHFTLKKAGAGPAYSLSIAKSIWTSFGPAAVRAEVRTSYRTFLQEVEAKGVTPWAIPLLRQLIATTMPQTFAETLYYRYGAWRGPKLRAADLEPGLRLRVSGALWQLVIGSQDERNGFVVSGEETYELSLTVPPDSSGNGIEPAARALSVDAFLSLLFPGAKPVPTKPVPAAGPLDFFGGSRRTYYRLFYPEAFLGSGSQGSSQISDNVAIVGAPSWATLEKATEEIENKSFLPQNNQAFVVYFRGRAALTPLLAARVGGVERWVPVGTTVRQLLAAAGLPIWPGGGAGGSVLLERATAGVWDHSFGDAPFRYEPVDLSETAIAAKQPPLWPLDLPVLGGDRVSVAPAAEGG